MKVCLWPFYSQQDKRTGEFLPEQCGNVKQMVYVGRALIGAGHAVRFVKPVGCSYAPFGDCLSADIPPHNPKQRSTFSLEDVWLAVQGCGVVVSSSEYFAIAARQIVDSTRIVQMCSVMPDSPLFATAWRAADLVVAQGRYAAGVVRRATTTRVTCWPLAYDERDFFGRDLYCERDIDVLFLMRCSATNYTHHEEFLKCSFDGLNVVFVDPTGYLRMQRPDLQYCTHSTYISTLYRSKVAVALNDNMYGGLGIREALRAGCTPVLLDAPCYRDLVQGPYKHFVRKDLSNLEGAVKAAVADECKYFIDVSHESYQQGFRTVLNDLENLR